MQTTMADLRRYLDKWQMALRLRDWDIQLRAVDTPWRKTGDIKIDQDDRKAVLLVNRCNPKQTNMEALIVHELLHLKLWAMDQMIESLIGSVYGTDEADAKRAFAYDHFMSTLEATVEDLAKGYMAMGGEDTAISFGRLEAQVAEEIGE